MGFSLTVHLSYSGSKNFLSVTSIFIGFLIWCICLAECISSASIQTTNGLVLLLINMCGIFYFLISVLCRGNMMTYATFAAPPSCRVKKEGLLCFMKI